MDYMQLSPREAAFVTVAYGDIFDYPLTLKEVKRWSIICPSPVIQGRHIEQENGYIFLKGRSGIVAMRIERQLEQKKKWFIAHRVAYWLSRIPTINLVAVTGGLAMGNARRDEDIDLFIISSFRTLWITRFFSTCIVQILGIRRKPDDTKAANKACLNMFMTPNSQKSEDSFSIPKKERDCYTAHEILQIKPLFIRGDTYRHFLYSNKWVQVFLPNAWKEAVRQINRYSPKKNIMTRNITRGQKVLDIFESIFKIIQLFYMQHHRTHEVINDYTIRFHPRDARVWIKRKLRKRLKEFKIPLDKIFYAR
jgi:hypothetical protein